MDRFRALFAGLHLFDGELNWSAPCLFWVVISDRMPLQVSADGGDYVNFDIENMKSFDMGKGGTVEIHDVTAHFAPNLANQHNCEFRRIHDGHGRAIGLAIAPIHGPMFCIWRTKDKFEWGTLAKLRQCELLPLIRPTIADDRLTW